MPLRATHPPGLSGARRPRAVLRLPLRVSARCVPAAVADAASALAGAAFALAFAASAVLVISASAISVATAARFQLPPHGDRSVHDLSGVLSPGSIEIMERRHAELYEKTGVALVVITVKRLEDETLPDFAVRVGSEWGVGKKGQDRGIVVAVTTDEPHVFVATGYGVEGFLPDGRVGAILDRYVVPALRNRDFDTALLQASTALVAVCAAEFGVTIGGVEPAPAGPRGAFRSLPLGLIFLFAVLVMIVFRMIILPRGRGGRYRGVWYGGGFGGGGFGGGGFGGWGGGFGGFGGGGFGGGGAGR